MAKISKSLYLNDDLCRLMDAQQEHTGASFTRIVTAAILQYFFGNYTFGPSQFWLKLATRFERGDVTFERLPIEVLEHDIDSECQALETLDEYEKEMTYYDVRKFQIEALGYPLGSWKTWFEEQGRDPHKMMQHHIIEMQGNVQLPSPDKDSASTADDNNESE